MIDAQAAGHIAKAMGKGIGLVWLLGHHGKAAWKTWRQGRAKRPKPPGIDPDAQIAQKEQDEQDGRLIREAIFNQMEQAQQIENLNALVRLKEQEAAQYRELAAQYQGNANEWQSDAESWRKLARQSQQELERRDAAWAAEGTSSAEQIARVHRESQTR